MHNILHLYHVKDRTIIPSLMPSRVVSRTRVSMWEGTRLEHDHVEAKCCTGTVKQEKDERVVTLYEVEANESVFHNILFDALYAISKHCIGVEYLKFRATCKLCRLAAPPIRWSNESSLKRLHNYSLNSPWLMVVDKHRGIVSFTDPISGDNYFMKKISHVLSIAEDQMYCSRYGWLLFESTEFECPVFFNPFTNDVRKLPPFGQIVTLCFSAPPNSSNCVVVGLSCYQGLWYYICHVLGGSKWHYIFLGDTEWKSSLIFIGRDLYALCEDGKVLVLKNVCSNNDNKGGGQKTALAIDPPISSCDSKSFLMNCDEHLLLVNVGDEFGQVEVFKLDDGADKWEKIDGIGKHTIYIGGPTCVCVDANTPEMENKIYFPQLVWYSLKTHTYHTSSDGKIVKYCFGDFFGTKTHLNSHAWIEPSWC